MTTSVRIERLVVHGLELSRWERAALGPAIARELRQLASGPVSGPARHRDQGSAVDQIAREVAAAVYRATAAARPPAGPGAPGGRR